jgi:hypothetical protein
MKIIFSILAILTFWGCTPSSRIVITDSSLEDDAVIIRQMTESISDNPNYFLSNLTLDTNKLAHHIDSLGFNFTIESGGYKVNERIYFWSSIIRQNDSVISFMASPFYWTIGGIWERKYDQIYKSADWKKEQYGFDDKYYNFEASINPIGDLSIHDSKYKKSIDSLMTPYYDYVYYPPFNPIIKPNKKRFDRIISKLSDKEILYLLNSINPATRAYTINYIKCDSKNDFDNDIMMQVKKLIQESPKVKSMFADIVMYVDLETLTDCKE